MANGDAVLVVRLEARRALDGALLDYTQRESMVRIGLRMAETEKYSSIEVDLVLCKPAKRS